MNNYNSQLADFLIVRQAKLKENIDRVCNRIDDADGDSWGLLTYSYGKGEINAAVRGLNGRLKTLIKSIPKLKIISESDIRDHVHQGMAEVRGKYEDVGGGDSEPRHYIDDILDDFFAGC